MRQRFEQQLSLRYLPISEIKIPLKSRDELPPVIRALQHIFLTPALNEKVFTLLEKTICAGKKNTGRKGMDLWHILVLAIVRHALGTNWDRLHLMANGDRYLREILGVYSTEFDSYEKAFEYQTIIDNVGLIDEVLLHKINAIVVDAGHELLKKKGEDVETRELQLKSDSYVLETNVYFPTDLRLLYDSMRKCFDTIKALRKEIPIVGWRKLQYNQKNFKSIYRSTSTQVFKGRSESKKKEKVTHYIKQSELFISRIEALIEQIYWTPSATVQSLIVSLSEYKDYAVIFTDQIGRRLLKGESIPSKEKIYSIFEPHTEWINKGKQSKKVELGHLILVTTDQQQLIVDYKVMENEKDAPQVKPLVARLGQKFPKNKIYSHSFDKGFYSNDNYECLLESGVENIVLPKKGRLSKKDKIREGYKEFKEIRNKHSAVESNINMLEHHGLNRCMDKGIHGYKRCVGLSVLAYNLHILGNAMLAQERKKQKQLEKRRLAYRKAS